MEKSMELKQRCINQVRPLMEMLLHNVAETDNDHWKNLLTKPDKSILDFQNNIYRSLPGEI